MMIYSFPIGMSPCDYKLTNWFHLKNIKTIPEINFYTFKDFFFLLFSSTFLILLWAFNPSAIALSYLMFKKASILLNIAEEKTNWSYLLTTPRQGWYSNLFGRSILYIQRYLWLRNFEFSRQVKTLWEGHKTPTCFDIFAQ